MSRISVEKVGPPTRKRNSVLNQEISKIVVNITVKHTSEKAGGIVQGRNYHLLMPSTLVIDRGNDTKCGDTGMKDE